MAKRIKGKKTSDTATKKPRVTRSFPASTFEEPLNFAKAILDFGSGQQVRRLSLFDHLQKSPESGPSRQLVTNANKYGLIKGSYAADHFELTEDGRVAVDEQVAPREQARARVKLAILGVEPFKALFEKFQGNKLPARAALIDAAKEAGVASAGAEEAVDTFIVNLRYVGLLRTLSGAERIISVEHLLDSIPTLNGQAAQAQSVSPSKGNLITAEQADFERTAFYIAPIGEATSEQRKHSDLFLGSLVEPALENFKLSVVRADAIDRPGVITKQIIEYLIKSRLVIADLSFHNPNVFYELAIRHMMRKPVVQIMRTGEKVPFDVNQVRTIIIDTTDIYSLVPKIDTYRSEIANQVRQALENPDAVDNPISSYFPNIHSVTD